MSCADNYKQAFLLLLLLLVVYVIWQRSQARENFTAEEQVKMCKQVTYGSDGKPTNSESSNPVGWNITYVSSYDGAHDGVYAPYTAAAYEGSDKSLLKLKEVSTASRAIQDLLATSRHGKCSKYQYLLTLHSRLLKLLWQDCVDGTDMFGDEPGCSSGLMKQFFDQLQSEAPDLTPATQERYDQNNVKYITLDDADFETVWARAWKSKCLKCHLDDDGREVCVPFENPKKCYQLKSGLQLNNRDTGDRSDVLARTKNHLIEHLKVIFRNQTRWMISYIRDSEHPDLKKNQGAILMSSQKIDQLEELNGEFLQAALPLLRRYATSTSKTVGGGIGCWSTV